MSIAAAPVASAHAGGRAQLYIERFNVQPGPAGWDVQVTLTDADSGQPEHGFAVSVSGSGPSGASFGPADLADSTNRGRYSGAVRATPGQWTMLINAHDVPGGPAAVAVSKRYEVTLTPGQASDPEGSVTVAAAAHHSRPSRLLLLAGVVLTGACACVVAAVRLARTRRRPAAPPTPSRNITCSTDAHIPLGLPGRRRSCAGKVPSRRSTALDLMIAGTARALVQRGIDAGEFHLPQM